MKDILCSFESANSASNHSGEYNGEATPVPIPNTEVKLSYAEGTWDVGPWETR